MFSVPQIALKNSPPYLKHFAQRKFLDDISILRRSY